MQSSFAPGADAASDVAATGRFTESDRAATGSIGFPAFFAPAPQIQTAQALEHIPGDFRAPDNPLLPPARPNFGDRQLAGNPAAEPRVPAMAFADPQTMTRAETASLGAYEFKAAGAPMPAGGLRTMKADFAPAQSDLAGVGRSGQPVGWRSAYDHVDTSCFPQTLRRALDRIATHFKSEVLVTSGKRERGRRGSLHRSCKAADIRVAGVAPTEVARFARTIPGINGVGTYRRVAVTHVDVRAERFAWRW